MTHLVAAVVIAVLAWWVSTGLVIMMARADKARRAFILGGAALLALAGAGGLWWSAERLSVAGAYAGFFSALALWAVNEILFLTGEVTGPNREPCPAGTSGRQRFRLAFATIRDHEVGLFATGLVIFALTFTAANPTGWMVYWLMWWVRLSTKLTVFLGAPNAVSELLPPRLAHLKTYFRTDRIHPFVGLALGLIAAATVIGFVAAGHAVGEATTVTFAILSTFAFLALVEHAFLILPLKDAALWRWALGRRDGKNKTGDAATTALATNRLA